MKPHLFHGYVTVEGGVLSDVKPTHAGWNAGIQVVNATKFQFRVEHGGGVEGVMFRATSPFVRFDLFIDDREDPRVVNVGAKKVHPTWIPFDVAAPPPPPAVFPGPNPMGCLPAWTQKVAQGAWLCTDPTGIWHFRVASAKARQFEGEIFIEQGQISGLNLTNKGWADSVYLTRANRAIRFRFEAGGFGEQGFDFSATSPAVRFFMTTDGLPNLKLIHVGMVGANPPGIPFEAVRQAVAVVAVAPPPPPAGNPLYVRPPQLRPTGAPGGYWVWASPNGVWHVRVTTATVHQFNGAIVTDGGVLTGARATRPEWQGGIVVRGPKRIEFAFKVIGGEDGFDFSANTPCIKFYTSIDGRPTPLTHIRIGGDQHGPPNANSAFEVCR
jgi:hypothetical protein